MKRIVIALSVVALSSASPALGQTWLFTGSATLTPSGGLTGRYSGEATGNGTTCCGNVTGAFTLTRR